MSKINYNTLKFLAWPGSIAAWSGLQRTIRGFKGAGFNIHIYDGNVDVALYTDTDK